MIKVININTLKQDYKVYKLTDLFFDFLRKSEHIYFDKGTIIDLKKYSSNLIFFSKGILREYTIDDSGNDFTIQFINSKAFILPKAMSYNIYFDSVKYLEVLQNSTLFVIDKESFFNSINDSYLIQEIITRSFFEQMYFSNERIKILLKKTIEQRYISFLSMYSDIIDYLPLSSIASFIGTTPSSLSRAKKHF